MPQFKEENANKINTMDLKSYFDDFISRRPTTANGIVSLSKENFKKMVDRTASDKDLATVVDAYVNYLGHRNILP